MNSRSESWHVVHIITQLELGGAQLATLHQAARSSFANERTLMFGPGGMLEPEALASPGVRCVPVPDLERPVSPGRDAKALGQITHRLRQLHRPGVSLLVHTHSSKAGVVGRAAARWVGADAVVHSIHGFGHSHHGAAPLRRAFLTAERWAGRVTDGFTADSQANLRQARREGIVRRHPTAVIPCGIDVAAFKRPPQPRDVLRGALGIARDAFAALNLSCFKPQKNLFDYVALAERMRVLRPDVVFFVAGDGVLRPQLEHAIRSRGLTQQVRLLGWRRDVKSLLHACDAFVMTSRWEGLPQSMMQAMAAGLPIVAYGVDGVPEAVDDGCTGYLATAGDVEALARGLTRLVDDRAQAQAMGAVAQQRVHRFGQSTMVADLDAFYDRVTRRSSGAASNPVTP